MTAEDVRRLRGKIPSPQALSERIQALEHKIKLGLSLMIPIAAGSVVVLIKFFLEH